MDLPFGLKDLRRVFQSKWFRDSMNTLNTGFLRMLLLHCQKQGIVISQIKQILKYHLATVHMSKNFHWGRQGFSGDKCNSRNGEEAWRLQLYFTEAEYKTRGFLLICKEN